MERTLDSGETPVEMVQRHERELHRRNGKEGLFTRMAEQETLTGNLSADMKRVKAMFWAIILLLLTILGGVVVDASRHNDAPQHSDVGTF